jgi:hypothetical protein
VALVDVRIEGRGHDHGGLDGGSHGGKRAWCCG